MTRDLEDKKWLDQYPSLKQVNKNNPFIVPEGYFSELDERITAAIKMETLKNKMPLGGFTVPSNYFEGLAGNIQSRIAVENLVGTQTGFIVPDHYFEELTNQVEGRIFVEETFSADNGFAVPDGYFEQLAGNIQSRIVIEEALNTGNGLTVPVNYFDELTGNIQSRIAIEEALTEDAGFAIPENYFDDLSSRINSRIFVEEALAGSAEAFNVPQGYFNELNTIILNQTVNHQQTVKRKPVKRNAKVVSIFRSTAFKYATAACLALMVGTGIFIQQFNTPAAVHNRSFLHKQLSNISADEIQNYLDVNLDQSDIQRSVAAPGASVNEADLKNALEDYSNNTQ